MILFAKAPVVGQVKTRLAAEIGAVRAAELHSAFVADTIAKLNTFQDIAERVNPPFLILYADKDMPRGCDKDQAEAFCKGLNDKGTKAAYAGDQGLEPLSDHSEYSIGQGGGSEGDP